MKWLLTAIAAIVLLLGLYITWTLNQPVGISSQAVEITIPSGTGIARAVDILEERNVVSAPLVHKAAAKIYSIVTGKRLQQGVFEIRASQSQFDAVVTLFQAPLTVNVTFPEGIMLEQFASIAAREIKCDSAEFMRLATSDSVCRARGIPASTVEGYLLPNTFNFFRRTRAEAVFNRLLDEQEKFWRREFGNRTSFGGRSKHDILTLASIIEAETPVDDEKSRVSGVYHNRLERGMRLQADPTVQYALGGSKQRLLYRDLGVDNPYNTYRYAGLPPGPINSPGAEAIRAAVRPEEHDYIYFVAVGDGTNRHRFAATKADHDRNVRLYRAARGR